MYTLGSAWYLGWQESWPSGFGRRGPGQQEKERRIGNREGPSQRGSIVDGRRSGVAEETARIQGGWRTNFTGSVLALERGQVGHDGQGELAWSVGIF